MAKQFVGSHLALTLSPTRDLLKAGEGCRGQRGIWFPCGSEVKTSPLVGAVLPRSLLLCSPSFHTKLHSYVAHSFSRRQERLSQRL
jgi:hypothetical protein